MGRRGRTETRREGKNGGSPGYHVENRAFRNDNVHVLELHLYDNGLPHIRREDGYSNNDSGDVSWTYISSFRSSVYL